MSTIKISSGVVHNVPIDVRKVLVSKKAIFTVWEDISPLARNEWLCWITSSKQLETRERRLRIMGENLLLGKRRPCCWSGCPHR